jgi:hypothetical protein
MAEPPRPSLDEGQKTPGKDFETTIDDWPVYLDCLMMILELTVQHPTIDISQCNSSALS